MKDNRAAQDDLEPSKMLLTNAMLDKMHGCNGIYHCHGLMA